MPPQNDGFRHEYATINGLKYHYVREGDPLSPPLLLIHGWPGFYYEWHRNIRPLAEHFDVVVPDMRGYAYTEKPDVAPEIGYTPAVFAQDIAALLDHLGSDKASFVTHDFGAVWVQDFARTHRDRVDKLVMFDPPYPGVGMRWLEPQHVSQVWYQMFHQLPWAEDLVTATRDSTKLYVSHFLSHWSHDKAIWTDDELEEFAEAFSQPGAVRGGFNCYRAVFRTIGQNQPDDPKIYVPTLILWGTDDAVLPLAWSDKLGDYFPNLTFREVADAGHWLMREQPNLVNKAVIDFVSKGAPE